MAGGRARRAVLATLLLVAAACGGDGDEGDVAGGTVPLFGGTVPPGGPAVDLMPSERLGREVVMIGDSITVSSAPLIVAASAGIDVDVTVLAEVGRRITVGSIPPAGIDVLADVLDEDEPDLLVVALGTNDVGQYSTIEEYAAQIDQLVEMVPRDTPLVWINVYLAGIPDRSATFNAALIETLQERGTATIGRWSSIAQRDGMLSDGIHPSEEGNQEFADLVVDEIEDWLG